MELIYFSCLSVHTVCVFRLKYLVNSYSVAGLVCLHWYVAVTDSVQNIQPMGTAKNQMGLNQTCLH
jgi:hypothetical protein